MSSVPAHLHPHEREEIRRLGERYDLRSPLAGYLEHVWRFWEPLHRERSTGKRAEKLIAGWSAQFPHWTREQVKTALSVHFLHEQFDLRVATARRMVHDDPAELAVGQCLAARLEWLERRLVEQSGAGTADHDLALVPAALAVRDLPLAAKASEPRPTALDRTEVEERILHAAGAAFRRDMEALLQAVDTVKRRKVPPWLRWKARCLIGIAEQSPEQVCAALQQCVDDENRARAGEEAENPVSMEAHAFYRLARWVSPELVAGFDAGQPLAWDAEFHAWVDERPDPLEGLDLEPVSPVLHDALLRFRLPDGWRALEEPESPHDVCRVILHHPGPDLATVRQLVDGWSRSRGAVELGRYPVIVAPSVPRHAAVSMRRSLLEAGASADFEPVRESE